MTPDAHLEQLTPEDVGLPEGARVPFRFAPGDSWSPLVISFPHVGLAWPHELRPKPQVEFSRNADYEVQTLYAGVPSLGAATVTSHFSRLVVDLNRAEDDVALQLVPDHPAPRARMKPGVPGSPAPLGWDRPGRGVVWASAMTGARGTTRILTPPLSYPAFESRLARFHRPYYRALEVLLQRRRERFGYAVLLDAHSMPGSVGVDLVLGTLEGTSCAEAVASTALGALAGTADRRSLLSVRRDDPYQGGEIVRTFGRPSDGVHALQLEVSRRLYMDERVYRVLSWPSDLRPLASQRGPQRPSGPGLQAPNRRRSRELHELVLRVRSLVRALSAHPWAQPQTRDAPTPPAS
ncbi:MAG: N-formylglutamate amidohydrolase [Nannocystaceae bacterium]|nr:N-formylglutamate amidohydrolase [Nannocystaceae bacterium]